MRETVDIFDEITEEVQQERLLKLWHTYKLYLFGSALLIILGTAAYSGWKHYHYKEVSHISTLYSKALALEKDHKTDEAASLFKEISKSDPSGFKAFSLLSLSDIYITRDRKEALQYLFSLAQNKKLPPSLRYLALLKSVLIDLDQEDPSTLKERLQPLLTQTNKGNAWYPLALELDASLEYRQGHLEKAEELYYTLSQSPLVPNGAHRRALRMLMIIKSQKKDSSL